MAVEEKKVSDAIELKFKGKSITKDFKKNLAKSWAAKIDNDADIDAYINDREDIVLEASAEGDRRATAAIKKPNDPTKPTKETLTVEVDEDELKDAPDWAKALIKSNKALNEKVAAFENKSTQQTLAERFQSDERLKNIPKQLLKGRFPKTDEEFEAAIEEATTDLKDFAKAEGNEGGNKAGFGNDKPRFSGKAGAQAADKLKPETQQAIDKVKAYTATLPGNKAVVEQK